MNTPNMQAVMIRGILIVAMSMALCVAVIHRAYTQPQFSTGMPTLARATLGQPAPVVLPTISVRPTAADIASALESEDDEAAAAFIEASQVQSLGSRASLPGLHLDMPYYSFGKALPRVSKE
jgi:hypothetical protein